MSKFIGREEELARLNRLLNKKSSSFVVVKGRRRIGKSRLIEEFAGNFDSFFRFSGLPPESKVSNSDQLKEFSNQICQNFSSPMIVYDDWTHAFWAVAQQVKQGKILLFFDEISWMGGGDPTFLGKVKNAWDNYFKHNDNLVFVVCGSASSWIEKNLLSSSGFVGRISLTINLKELSLDECNHFWPKYISIYEKLKILAITGGVPKYLEEVDSQLSAEDNILNLCFTDGGFLVEEFDRIFSDIFLRTSSLYKSIVRVLSTGVKTREEIQKKLGLSTSGRISEYLNELESSGFISRDYTWNIVSCEDSKLSKYRLKDNYLRFYINYIEKNRDKIERGLYRYSSLDRLSNWYAVLGLQFENLVLNQRKKIINKIGVKTADIIMENPYFQRKTKRQNGCQIDWMIQTKYNTLYICEIKFSKNKIGCNVISEIENKISSLPIYRKFSCRPVLIHVNGVTDELLNKNYFSNIIDFSDFLRN